MRAVLRPARWHAVTNVWSSPAGVPIIVPTNDSIPGFRPYLGRSMVGQHQLACPGTIREGACRLLGTLEVSVPKGCRSCMPPVGRAALWGKSCMPPVEKALSAQCLVNLLATGVCSVCRRSCMPLATPTPTAKPSCGAPWAAMA